jgi:uncharacterized protein YaiL (DUF2058 family)
VLQEPVDLSYQFEDIYNEKFWKQFLDDKQIKPRNYSSKLTGEPKPKPPRQPPKQQDPNNNNNNNQPTVPSAPSVDVQRMQQDFQERINIAATQARLEKEKREQAERDKEAALKAKQAAEERAQKKKNSAKKKDKKRKRILNTSNNN